MPLTESLQNNPGFATAVGRARSSAAPMILIAEDSGDSREMMTTLLELKGFDVVSAENGVNAVNLALAELPDLILLDLDLPELDGIAVTRSLRRHSQFRDIPIVILSGHDPCKFRPLALAAGCTEYLLKPINFQRLDELLNSLS